MHDRTNWIERDIGTPGDRPGEWVTVPYRFGGRELLLTQPREPDLLLNDAAVQAANRQSDYMPYWGFLWPGALLLAERVLCEPWRGRQSAVEIGCGLGLAGLAAIAAGLHVTFTDHSPAALALAEYNARLNGFQQFATRLVDWRSPPPQRFDIVLGADVLYERRCLDEVLNVLDSMLDVRGIALISDPGRAVADSFEPLARARGYTVHCESARATQNDRQIVGRIFRLHPLDDHRPETRI